MKNKAYNKGYQAWRKNVSYFDNPYPEYSKSADDWDKGWKQACSDDAPFFSNVEE